MFRTVLILLSSLFLSTDFAIAQCGTPVHHWESLVLESHSWKYQVPISAINLWNQVSFNDASWNTGAGGIGYGDGDDVTLVPNPSRTVYMRRTFNVIDTSAIQYLVLCMDYDDAFVAYLNGHEIARANIQANPAWNALSLGPHEATMYQGLPPEYFIISAAATDTLLQPGINVLSIEIHNESITSSDLSARPFLQAAITNATYFYAAVPSWFVAPAILSSQLPILHINTLGQTIMDDPRITCDLGIIDNGPGAINCLNDPFNGYQGKITIEYRGSTSQNFPKKPYGFSTVDASGNNLNVSLLDYPDEHDFTLLNPYTDKSFMRDVIIHDLGRSLNWYSSRVRFVELVINNQNQGVYVLMEKIKRDKQRVDIAKMTPTGNAGDSLTGGYIFKVDKYTGSSGGGWTTNHNVDIQHHDPDWNDITTAQHNYLVNYINTVESSMWSSTFTNPGTGYRRYANVFSFADFFILNELSNNIDGYRLSTFVHKDQDSRCGRFTMGPYWDFNLSFGNGNYCNGAPATGWQLYAGCGMDGGGYWMNRLLQDTWFKNLVSCRWSQLRQNILSTNSLMLRIDSMANEVREAASRDSAIWQTIGTWVWPNAWVATTWQGEIDSMKQWLNNRLNWMDANMFPSTVACNSLAGINVVIDEINFNSDSTTSAGDWLELYNDGTSPVDLSYAMILDGNKYRQYCVLPNNTIISAGGRLVVYADSLKFFTQFPGISNAIGPLCFSLSNGGQQIVLRDKDQRLIFQFTYDDTWQCASDGHGRTLQLLNTSANPDLQDSWFAACMGGSPGSAYTPCNESLIYAEINYHSSLTQDAGDWVELHNRGTSSMNLGNWKLRDKDFTHVFTFPSSYMLAPGKYVVLYSDALKINTRFPTLQDKLGPIGFELANDEEVIRLYDASDKLMYSVCYQSAAPWPNQANGLGRTLENASYAGNPNQASNWFAGCPEGSPGMAYNPGCIPLNVPEAMQELVVLFPNPSQDWITIRSASPVHGLNIYSLDGKLISTLSGNQLDRIPVHHLSPGLYLLEIQIENRVLSYRITRN